MPNVIDDDTLLRQITELRDLPSLADRLDRDRALIDEVMGQG